MYDEAVFSLLVAAGYIAFLVGGLIRVYRSPMSDAAKGVWIPNIFLIPLFGLLLSFAFVPGPDEPRGSP